MEVIVVGLSRSSASLPAFEELQRGSALERVEQRLRTLAGVRETVRLVTCRRIVFVVGVSFPLRSAVDAHGSAAPGLKPRRGGPSFFVTEFKNVLLQEARASLAEAEAALSLETDIYTLVGHEAFGHLVRLATGLEPPMKEETEVLEQLRTAYAEAVERQATGPILSAVFHRVFRTARRIGSPAARPIVPAGRQPDVPAAVADSPRAAGSRLENEIAAFAAWQREREIAPSIVRLGRLLELSGLGAAAEDGAEAFRRRLLQGFAAVAGEAGDEEEASLRLALFERALRRATARSVRRAAGVRSESREVRTPTRDGHDAVLSGLGSNSGPASWPGARGSTGATSASGETSLRAGADGSAGAYGAADAASRTLVVANDTIPSSAGSGTSTEGSTRAQIGNSRLPSGAVSLVGAGPGDPGLLTLKAAIRLAEADVVYYDALVGDSVLAHCRPGARLVAVGKRRGAASLPQEEIEAALVRDARAGLAVVRLKGGDPFVFGRGGEEALALIRREIPFEVVPGVCSGVAIPALAKGHAFPPHRQ